MKISLFRAANSRAFFFALCTFVLGAVVLVRAEESNKDLHLVFTGSGNVSDSQTSFENKYNFKTKSYESGTSTSVVKKPFTGSGYVEIATGIARIKLPRAMIPPLNGGKDGWFTIDKFEMTETAITGTLRLNAINKPKLRIDRTTGTISIEGSFSDFTGQCDLVQSEPEKRKF